MLHVIAKLHKCWSFQLTVCVSAKNNTPGMEVGIQQRCNVSMFSPLKLFLQQACRSNNFIHEWFFSLHVANAS